jgi:hypothetical protein
VYNFIFSPFLPSRKNEKVLRLKGHTLEKLLVFIIIVTAEAKNFKIKFSRAPLIGAKIFKLGKGGRCDVDADDENFC